jgi:hypothetical protein
MANLAESAAWEDAITQIETTTPWVGGLGGTSNMQALILAKRTRWLKQFADELAAARGGQANLDARLDQYDAFDPANIAGLYAFSALGIDLAGLAGRETQKTIHQRIQSGITLITNRGIIAGCTVSKSTNAIRNLSLTAGSLFVNGVMMSCPAMENSAIVASNAGSASQVCYGYLFLDSAGMVRFSVTEFGVIVPDNGISLCRITVPAGNTQVSDPNLASVTITDVRRVEAGYPIQVNSIAYASVALPYTLIDSDYEILLDIQSAKGGLNQRSSVYAGDKAANGFKLYVEGSLDAVSVRWIAIKLNL